MTKTEMAKQVVGMRLTLIDRSNGDVVDTFDDPTQIIDSISDAATFNERSIADTLQTLLDGQEVQTTGMIRRLTKKD